jgi:hypothetical protein
MKEQKQEAGENINEKIKCIFHRFVLDFSFVTYDHMSAFLGASLRQHDRNIQQR